MNSPVSSVPPCKYVAYELGVENGLVDGTGLRDAKHLSAVLIPCFLAIHRRVYCDGFDQYSAQALLIGSAVVQLGKWAGCYQLSRLYDSWYAKMRFLFSSLHGIILKLTEVWVFCNM